ncbi:MAG: matrixin family metalloprotease [Candidatus Obscuribacterales bacterium]|nr:matrixin family metalloprotease [Candidatus Obscuribacterales bacterium]
MRKSPSITLLSIVAFALTGCSPPATIEAGTLAQRKPNKIAVSSASRSIVPNVGSDKVRHLIALASSHIDQDKFSEARKELNEAVALNRDCFEAYYYLAQVDDKTDKLPEALLNAQKALRYRTEDFAGWRLLCRLQLRSGRLKEGEDSVNKCMALASKDEDKAEVLGWKAYLARMKAKWRDAAYLDEQSKKLASDRPDVWGNLWVDYLQQGRLQEAKEFLENCINKFPTHPSANEWMRSLSQLDSIKSSLGVKGVRWPAKAMPVRVFVDNHGVAFTENEHFRNMIVDQLTTWSGASEGKVTFKLVNDQSNCDLTVKFTNSPLDVSNGDDVNAGLTMCSTEEDHDFHCIYLKKSRIFLMAFEPNTNKPISENELKYVALHELGHALGLKHSICPEDTMFPVVNKDFSTAAPPVPTNNDLVQLKKLYQ